MTPSEASDRTATDLFEQIISQQLAVPRVQMGTGFGAVPGLRVGKKIFVMLFRGDLVVKLPRHRVDQLVEEGTAFHFDARGDGRLMKEWATISPTFGHVWEDLAVEARQFVGGEPSSG